MKHIDDSIFGSRWDLLKRIAERPRNPSNLAQEMKTSLANITQQLKLLEAYGLVEKGKEETIGKKVGKPKLEYSMSDEVCMLAIAGEGFAGKKALPLNGLASVFFKMVLSASADEAAVLGKFILLHEEVFHKCQGIGLLKTGKDSMELFLHTEAVDEIRKKYSNTTIQDITGRNKKVICWTHSDFEIEEGLKRKDPYFLSMFRNMAILLDRSKNLVRAKRRVMYAQEAH